MQFGRLGMGFPLAELLTVLRFRADWLSVFFLEGSESVPVPP